MSTCLSVHRSVSVCLSICLFLYVHRSVSVCRSMSDMGPFVDPLFKHWYPIGLGRGKILYPGTQVSVTCILGMSQLENIHLYENNK